MGTRVMSEWTVGMAFWGPIAAAVGPALCIQVVATAACRYVPRCWLSSPAMTPAYAAGALLAANSYPRGALDE